MIKLEHNSTSPNHLEVTLTDTVSGASVLVPIGTASVDAVSSWKAVLGTVKEGLAALDAKNAASSK